ncbi:MAG TPA: glycosyltransferase family 39 protein [Xanthobacteraceae bacterium]|nr:glycosyltransferase family 39 protein [Xanthobacteraceae bacterium]
MKLPTLLKHVEAAVGRLLDALSDPKRRGRTVILVLAAYWVIWTLYAVVAKASQDFHFDMGEMVAWSREITFGTPKHPPLPAWLVGAWFSIFPLATWAYDLFAVGIATVSLGVAFVVSTRYLDGLKSAVGLAVLTLVPFFNFHALKFNANSAMMPWWALTTWFFLRSFESRGLGFSALAGVAAAGAMLTKYWSVVLLAALAIGAVSDPRRRLYFTSAAPFVIVVVGAAALSPHVVWLYLHDFGAFGYALESHPGTVIEAFISGIGYLAGALGYAVVPILLTGIAAKPAPADFADMLWPGEPQRRLAVVVFILPLVLPTLLAVAATEKVVSLWAIGGMTLLPVVLLSSPRIVIPRIAAIRILAIAICFPVLAVLAAPIVAVVTHFNGIPNFGTQYSLVAAAAGKVWRETTAQPLRLIGSYDNVLNGSAFYFPDRPSTFDIVNPAITPWADEARIARQGIVLYCPVTENRCMDALNRRAAVAPQGRRVEVDISRTFLGIPGPVTRYVITAIPPQ